MSEKSEAFFGGGRLEIESIKFVDPIGTSLIFPCRIKWMAEVNSTYTIISEKGYIWFLLPDCDYAAKTLRKKGYPDTNSYIYQQLLKHIWETSKIDEA